MPDLSVPPPAWQPNQPPLVPSGPPPLVQGSLAGGPMRLPPPGSGQMPRMGHPPPMNFAQNYHYPPPPGLHPVERPPGPGLNYGYMSPYVRNQAPQPSQQWEKPK